MVVLVMDNAPINLRGELTKWLLEVKPGVFAGKISAIVRQKLWERVCSNKGVVGAVLLYSMGNEQGFSMEMHGTPYRKVENINGLQLITIEGEEEETSEEKILQEEDLQSLDLHTGNET